MDSNEKLYRVSKLCSNISTCKDLDNFLLSEDTKRNFSLIFERDISIQKRAKVESVSFTCTPQRVGSFNFYIESVVVSSDLEPYEIVFKNISEIIRKREEEFTDDTTGLPNSQGFIQSLINSALDYKEYPSSFIALKIKSENFKIDNKFIKKVYKEIDSLNLLSELDIVARWSENIFCFLISQDSEYRRGIEFQTKVRDRLREFFQESYLNVQINIGIHRVPKGAFEEFHICTNTQRDIEFLEIIKNSNFKNFIVKTFNALAEAIDTTLVVGTTMYKDLKTKKFKPISQKISTETILNLKGISYNV